MVGFNPEQKEEPINLYESKGCHLPRCAVDGGTTGRAGDLAPRPHGIILKHQAWTETPLHGKPGFVPRKCKERPFSCESEQQKEFLLAKGGGRNYLS